MKTMPVALVSLLGLVFIAVVGILDYLTGYEIAFSLFYLIPIFLVTWFAGKRLGLLTSIASTAAWLLADIESGHNHSHVVIYYWNTAVRFSFFIIVTLLLSSLKEALEKQKALASIDYLTGAVNSRFFHDLLQREMDRSHRYGRPFSVVYFDLDHFKMVNDQLGHSIGNQVLITVVGQARSMMRKTDIIARLGGDEFAFLLPETDQEAARTAISKIQTGLLNEMKKNNWPVTFSIGVLTCITPPKTTDELIKIADSLMYTVKNNGKNGVGYSIY